MTRLPQLGIARLAAVFLLLWLAILAVTDRLVRPWSVQGPSMEPTLFPGERLLVDVWTYRQRAPYPGEVVLLEGPARIRAPLVKRVATGPGAAGEEPGIWVLGDNPEESVDSRSFGAVPRSRVIGRVVFRYWPLSRAGPVR